MTIQTYECFLPADIPGFAVRHDAVLIDDLRPLIEDLRMTHGVSVMPSSVTDKHNAALAELRELISNIPGESK